MKNWKFLLLLFLCLVITKSLLASLVPAPSMFSDEYEYAKIAQSIWDKGEFKIHGKATGVPPIYPLSIAPAYIFDDMRVVYLAIKIINALISSLIILPAYFLAKELMNKRLALIATTLVGILPASFSNTTYIMAENLFLVLMLTAAYVLYKILTKTNGKRFALYLALAAITVLTYFTKILGILLFPAIAIACFVKASGKQSKSLRNKLLKMILLVGFFSIVILAVLRFFPLYQYIDYILPKIENTLTQMLVSFIFWTIAYSGYLILASGFVPTLRIFSTRSLTPNKRNYLLVVGALAISGIAIAIKHNINTAFLNTTIFSLVSGRPMGRYLDYLLPLIIIGSFATITTKINKKATYILSALAIISAIILSTYDLIPINNSSLSIFGIAKLILENLSGSVELLSISYFLISIIAAMISIMIIATSTRCEKATSIAVILAALFMITNTINYSVTIYNSETYWYNGEQMQLGLLINDNKDMRGKTILVDEKYEGKLLKLNQSALHESGSATILGFWIKNPLKIGSTQDLKGINYVVTKEKLNMQLIKQTTNEIYLYKVPDRSRK